MLVEPRAFESLTFPKWRALSSPRSTSAGGPGTYLLLTGYLAPTFSNPNGAAGTLSGASGVHPMPDRHGSVEKPEGHCHITGT